MNTCSNASRFVIIGGGQSAALAARTLCMQGFAGTLTIVGEEPHLPYERPPLSKAVLTATASEESTCLMPQGFVSEQNIDFRGGLRATAINRASREVTLSDGSSLPYDRLLIATGSRPRALAAEFVQKANVFYLRTLEDSKRIRAAIAPGKTLLAIGAGWIGLEVAATARKLGMEAVVVEMADRACGRSLPRDVGDELIELHRSKGTRVLLQTQVTATEGDARVERVHLSNGETLDVAAIVIGIGAVANDELAREAGLEVENGIVVDSFARTSDPLIHASGDVAAVRADGGLIRFESWANAQDQGAAAARNMLGQDIPYEPNTWFWSDQYDVNIQMIGRITDPEGKIFIRRADGGRFTRFCVRDGRITGAITFGQPRDMTFARKLIQKGYVVTGDELETSEDLRKLL